MSEGVQVAAGAKLHDEAREMRGLKLSVESRKERMVEHLQDFSLHLRSVDFLLRRQSVFVHHLHRVTLSRIHPVLIVLDVAVTGAFQPAEVDGADVTRPDAADDAEVPEGQRRAAAGATDGGVPGVRRAVRLRGEVVGRHVGVVALVVFRDFHVVRRPGGVVGEAAEAAATLAAHGAALA